jgi:kojibiose phosphorylase
VVFDLDGVLTDTAELHFQSWMDLAREFDIPFDRQANEQLRGLSRPESLRLFLGTHASRFTPEQQTAIMDAKNKLYVERVRRMTPADALPGARELLVALRERGVRTAVASSSKNARPVLDKLDMGALLDAVVDGHDAPASKPDPLVFLLAAERVGVPPAKCVVVEDAESGVAGALAAGMKVVGVGPVQRVGAAHRVVSAMRDLTAETVLSLVDA